MGIEGFSDYDDMIGIHTTVQVNWMQHQVTEKTNIGISHLLKGYANEGWGKMKNGVKPMNANASAGVSASWGGGEVVYTIDVSGSVSDDNGNHLDVTISQDSDGRGSAEISAGVSNEEKEK